MGEDVCCGSELKSHDAAVAFLGQAASGAARQRAHTNETLALAALRLRERDPQSCALFASAAQQYDLRDAWLGAAVSYHLHGNPAEAGSALVQVLSRYAHQMLPHLVDEIVAATGACGWAALYSSGRIAVRLCRPAGVHVACTCPG